MITVRDFEPSDLPEIHTWCEAWGVPKCELWFLSETGFVAEHYGKMLAAMWLYTPSNSKVCFIDNTIAALGISKDLRRSALDAVASRITEAAKSLGFRSVITWSRHKGLFAVAKAAGYYVTEPEYAVIACTFAPETE